MIENSTENATGVENPTVCQRPQFGNRKLEDANNVFQHNAWDNVVWDEEQEKSAREITENQLKSRLSEDKADEFEREAGDNWNKFYGIHQNRFFKDRHWLFTEFPELLPPEEETEGATSHSNACNILEVGCGVGNTVFPVLKTNQNANLKIYCCDFSSTAIDIVKEHTDYNPDRCHAFVCDITNESSHIPFPDGSQDIVILIFVMSAISPEKRQYVVNRLARFLRPGGTILFRDYGRYDLAQLRFKQGRCLSENFYVRGDGTRAYFFTQEELKAMFETAGLVEKQNLIDRRLQVNRGKQLKIRQYVVNRLARFLRPGGTILFRDYGRYDLAQLRFKQGRCLSENFYVRGDGTRDYFFYTSILNWINRRSSFMYFREKEEVLKKTIVPV